MSMLDFLAFVAGLTAGYLTRPLLERGYALYLSVKAQLTATPRQPDTTTATDGGPGPKPPIKPPQ